jgi:UDP-glucose 4-epimerase
MQGVDAVVHLAAVVSVPFSVTHPKLTYAVNVEGTRRVMHQCVASHVTRFILVSSCAVYGEPQYVPTDELHPVNPLSAYAESKRDAEQVCWKELQQADLEKVVLRLFNVYGSRQGSSGYAGVISSFIECLAQGLPLPIYGDGLQTRDFVHVSDVVEAIWLALTTAEVDGILNVGSERAIEIRELAELISQALSLHSCSRSLETEISITATGTVPEHGCCWATDHKPSWKLASAGCWRVPRTPWKPRSLGK